MTALILQDLVQQEKEVTEYLNTLKAIRLGTFNACNLYDCKFAEYMTPEEVMFEYLTDVGPVLKINDGFGFKCTLAYDNSGDTAWVDTVDGTVTVRHGRICLGLMIDLETLGLIIRVLRFRLGRSS